MVGWPGKQGLAQSLGTSWGGLLGQQSPWAPGLALLPPPRASGGWAEPGQSRWQQGPWPVLTSRRHGPQPHRLSSLWLSPFPGPGSPGNPPLRLLTAWVPCGAHSLLPVPSPSCEETNVFKASPGSQSQAKTVAPAHTGLTHLSPLLLHQDVLSPWRRDPAELSDGVGRQTACQSQALTGHCPPAAAHPSILHQPAPWRPAPGPTPYRGTHRLLNPPAH